MKYSSFASLHREQYYIGKLLTDFQFWQNNESWSTPNDGRINNAIMMPLTRMAIYTFPDGRRMEAYPGDIVLMPKGSIYTCTFKEVAGNIIELTFQGAPRSCLFLGFDIFDENFEEMSISDIPNVIITKANQQIIKEFIKLCKTNHRQDFTPSLFYTETLNFICSLSKEIYSSENNPKDVEFYSILEFIRSNFNEATPARLIEISDFSPATLRRRFSEKLGMTPTEYINSVRIDNAKNLLKSGITKIRTISTLCGFTDEFYFSRVFTKIAGMSPTAYLKMIKNKNK